MGAVCTPSQIEFWDFIAVVSGTRETSEPNLARAVKYQLDAIPAGALVVHGACGWDLDRPNGWDPEKLQGADRFADRIALDRGFGVKRFPAAWSRDGKKAGPRRNEAMIDWAKAHGREVVLLAFPIKGGRGTQGAIAYAQKPGVGLEVRQWMA